MIEQAVKAFIVLNPDTAVVEAALVSGGVLHEESKLMDVAVDGTVIPAEGTVCV